MISSFFTPIPLGQLTIKDQTANVFSIDYGLISSHQQGKHQKKTALYALANETHCWKNGGFARTIQAQIDYHR
ncbi:MAG TPA: hypothetical protein DEF45_07840 [Rhodopirellula sp.]|nr:hypothetical protein [Rhodopirellula sp.]